VRIFEIGRCFTRDAKGEPVSGFSQPLRLGGISAGSALPEQWGSALRPVDFFDVKSDIESLFGDNLLRWEKLDHPALHPGRSAQVFCAGQPIGIVGELHPRWTQKYDLATSPVVFELDIDVLLKQALSAYRQLSNFPTVTRDLALVVDQALSWQQLLDVLKQSSPALVSGIELFDVYSGKGVADGRKSLAFRIVMQDTQRTLADAEVDVVIVSMIAAAEQKFGAELRR